MLSLALGKFPLELSRCHPLQVILLRCHVVQAMSMWYRPNVTTPGKLQPFFLSRLPYAIPAAALGREESPTHNLETQVYGVRAAGPVSFLNNVGRPLPRRHRPMTALYYAKESL
jgi:hypothetical protein